MRIDAWSFDLDRNYGTTPLSSAEIERANAIPNPLLRSRYQRTRSNLRTLLAARLGIPPLAVSIEIAPGGKPQLRPPAPIYFSLSHSQDILVIAICEEAIGVDVEIPRPRGSEAALAERFFSSADCRALEAEPGDRSAAFLRQWVAKEAALKAAGLGLSEVLRETRCTSVGGQIRAVSWPGHSASIETFALENGATGAFAWFGNARAVVEWHDDDSS